MKKATKINLALLALTLSANGLYAQQGFGTKTPNKASVIDMTSGTKGVLVPRVALTSTEVFAPVSGIDAANQHTANSLLVYNTAANGSGATAVSPGYYYWEKPNAGTAGKWVRLADSNAAYIEPWQVQGTGDKAINNTQSIYQEGNVAIGTTSATTASSKKLNVVGDLRARYENGGNYYGVETGDVGLGVPMTAMYASNNVNPFNATQSGSMMVMPGTSIFQATMGQAEGIITATADNTNGGNINITAYGTDRTVSSELLGKSTNISLTHSKLGGESSAVIIEKNKGVTFNFNSTSAAVQGNYTFPRTNGNANQVLTTNGVNGAADLSWTDISSLADVRRIGTNHISEDAGLGGNGSAMPGNFNIAIGAGAMGHANPTGVSGPLGLAGNIAVGGGNQLDRVNSAGSVAIGYGNLPVATTGQNVAIGPLNLTAVTTGNSNMSLGINNAPALTTGNGNITMGSVNLTTLTEGAANIAIGNESLKKITTQEQNIAIGNNVLKNIAGTNNDKNIGVGHDILTVLTNGKDNVGFGTAAGGALTTGSYNTFFGTEAGNRILGLDPETVKYKGGSYSLFLGSQTKARNTVDSQLNIGNWIYGENGNIALGNFNDPTPLPTITPTTRLDVVSGNVRIGTINANAGTAAHKMVVADADGVLKTVAQTSVAIEPWQEQITNVKATNNTQNIYQTGSVAIGKSTITTNTDGNNVTTSSKFDVLGAVRVGESHFGSIGLNSLVTGLGNRATGAYTFVSGAGNSALAQHVFVAGNGNVGSGTNAIAIGGTGNTASGANAGALGGNNLTSAGFSEIVTGQYNALTTAPAATALGISTERHERTLLQIGNGSSTARNNALTLTQSGRLGVGIAGADNNALPTQTLDVGNGNVRVRDINATTNTGTAAHKMVVADANGVLKTVKQAPRFFYMPAVIFDTSVASATVTHTRDIYEEYRKQFAVGTYYVTGENNDASTGTGTPIQYTGGVIGSVGAPATITTYLRGELYYYVTYYDQNVFEAISITADGKLSYRIKSNASPSSYMNIVFVVIE